MGLGSWSFGAGVSLRMAGAVTVTVLQISFFVCGVRRCPVGGRNM